MGRFRQLGEQFADRPAAVLQRVAAHPHAIGHRVPDAGFLVSIVSVVYLVSSLVLGGVFAAVAGGIIALVAVWSWFFLPLVRFESS
jgi:Zn-dependent protease